MLPQFSHTQRRCTGGYGLLIYLSPSHLCMIGWQQRHLRRHVYGSDGAKPQSNPFTVPEVFVESLSSTTLQSCSVRAKNRGARAEGHQARLSRLEAVGVNCATTAPFKVPLTSAILLSLLMAQWALYCNHLSCQQQSEVYCFFSTITRCTNSNY